MLKTIGFASILVVGSALGVAGTASAVPLTPAVTESLFEPLSRPSPSASCANTNSAWRGGVESRCGRTDIGRVMRRV